MKKHLERSSDHHPFLEGQRIILRPLSVKDISSTYHSWLNDPEVNRFNSHAIFPYTKGELLLYVKSVSRDRSKVILAIIDRKTDKHIGNVALQSIDWVGRSAELAILIGEKTQWGKGIGVEVGKLIVNYGFNRLGLHRIWCGTSSDNIGMQKIAERTGMKREGVRRDAMFKNGRWVNIIEYGILQSEFEQG